MTDFISTLPPIGISGAKRSGKNTLGNFLAQSLKSRGLSTRALAFADPLREALYALDPYIATGVRLQPVVDVVGWEGLKETAHESEVRRLLQHFGTDAIRALDQTFWVRITEDRIGAARQGGAVPVVTDVRFANESRMIASLGGMVIHVTRDTVMSADGHSSEDVDKLPRHYTVPNDGDLADLRIKAEHLIEMYTTHPRWA